MWKCCLKCSTFPPSDYMFKVSKRNARTRCEICSKLTIKTVEQRQCHRFGIFRGQPHSAYAQRGRGRVKPNAHDCVQGGSGGFQGCVRKQKKFFFGPQNLKIFLFLSKRSYYIAIYYFVQKSVNWPQAVKRNHRTLCDSGLIKFNLRDD